MATKKIEIQDSNGNVYYPHTDASVVKNGSKTVAEQLNDLTNDKLNISDLYKIDIKQGFSSFNNCFNNGGGHYRVYNPTDFPPDTGYTSDCDFLVEVIKDSDSYGTMFLYDMRSDRFFMQKKINNKWNSIKEVTTTENFNFENTLVNGWHVENCSFRGKKIGNEMFIEGIIVNNLESPNKTIAQGIPIPSDGKWHGGSSMCSDNSSIYLVLQPNGDLLFQTNGQKKDLLYTISINYPV